MTSPARVITLIHRLFVTKREDGVSEPHQHPCREVAKFRADLTLEQLDNYKIDDWYGFLVRFAEAKWFRSLIDEHSNED